MAQPVARRPMNFLEMLAQNPRGWGPVGPASPEEGVGDPNELERGQNALAMFGPVAEAAAPNMLQMATDPRGTVKGQARDMAAEVPYMLAGPVLGAAGRVARAAPRIAAAAGGLGLTAIPSRAGEKEKPSEEVKALQIKLRDAGYYTGKIDGLMKLQTQTAKKAFEKDEAERVKAETERKRVEAGEKETQRLAEESGRKSKEREAGTKRLQEMQKNETWYGKAFRDYGPMIATGLGLAAGALGRRKMVKTFNFTSEEAARKADAYLYRGGDIPSRAGGVNRFWQEGGASAVPFTAAPRAKYAVKSNRAAPSATTLYPPQPSYLRPNDYGIVGAGITEGVGSGAMAWQANTDLAEAQRAVSEDPSEANIQRLEAARNQVAIWESLSRAGFAGAGGYAGAIPKMRYSSARPNVSAAEGERLAIDQIINLKAGARRPRSPKK